MRISAEQFRDNLYEIIDQVLQNDKIIEVEYKGNLFTVVSVEKKDTDGSKAIKNTKTKGNISQ